MQQIHFQDSDMNLKVHSDSSYLSEANAKSRIGGFFYLGSIPTKSIDSNGDIHITSNILKHVVTSSDEAEY